MKVFIFTVVVFVLSKSSVISTEAQTSLRAVSDVQTESYGEKLGELITHRLVEITGPNFFTVCTRTIPLRDMGSGYSGAYSAWALIFDALVESADCLLSGTFDGRGREKRSI